MTCLGSTALTPVQGERILLGAIPRMRQMNIVRRMHTGVDVNETDGACRPPIEFVARPHF